MAAAGFASSSIRPAVKSPGGAFPAGGVSWGVVAPGAKNPLREQTHSEAAAEALALGLRLADPDAEGERLAEGDSLADGLGEALPLAEGEGEAEGERLAEPLDDGLPLAEGLCEADPLPEGLCEALPLAEGLCDALGLTLGLTLELGDCDALGVALALALGEAEALGDRDGEPAVSYTAASRAMGEVLVHSVEVQVSSVSVAIRYWVWIVTPGLAERASNSSV